jgi:hypothetical protein
MNIDRLPDRLLLSDSVDSEKQRRRPYEFDQPAQGSMESAEAGPKMINVCFERIEKVMNMNGHSSCCSISEPADFGK